MTLKDADKSKPYLPLAGATQDGYNNGTEATATCFCGQAQYEFTTKDVAFVFVCNCTDCHKLHSSMLGCNFIIPETSVRMTRGDLSTYSTSKSIGSGNTMTNSFCGTCGTLMWRKSSGWPDKLIPRVGTIDDFNLQERMLPNVEVFADDRVSWLHGAEGVRQLPGNQLAEVL